MQISTEAYPEMRAWLARVTREIFPPELLTAETDPLAALDAINAASPAKARKGLSMALGDMVELTNSWPAEKVEALDRRLMDEGMITLSAVRVRFSKAVQQIVRRGCIKDEAEYYAVRNAAEQAGRGDDQLSQLLTTYEGNATR